MKCNLICRAFWSKGLQLVKPQFWGLLLAGVIAISGCGNDDPVNPIDHIVLPAKQDVYIGGYANIGMDFWAATYWKNEEIVFIGDGKEYTIIEKVIVNDEHVYAVGQTGDVAVLWKDAEKIELNSNGNTALATNIIIENNKAYILGRAKINGAWTMVYWVDGEMFVCVGSSWSSVTEFTVSGGKVYVVGHKDGNDGQSRSGYWENGLWNEVGEAGSYGYGISVTTKGIIISGESKFGDSGKEVATLWVNGNPIYLSTEWSTAYGIKVLLDDIYVAGIEIDQVSKYSQAILWKNGVKTILSGPTEGVNTYAYFVEVSNKGEVYVLGDHNDVYWYSLLWKDGELTAPFESNKEDRYGRGLSLN
jgi:hypothetical protein